MESEVVNMGEPPAGFIDAVVRRVEDDVLPDLPPELAAAWRARWWSWRLYMDPDVQKIAVEVSVQREQGVFPIALFDGETVGFVCGEDGWEWVGTGR